MGWGVVGRWVLVGGGGSGFSGLVGLKITSWFKMGPQLVHPKSGLEWLVVQTSNCMNLRAKQPKILSTF